MSKDFDFLDETIVEQKFSGSIQLEKKQKKYISSIKSSDIINLKNNPWTNNKIYFDMFKKKVSYNISLNSNEVNGDDNLIQKLKSYLKIKDEMKNKDNIVLEMPSKLDVKNENNSLNNKLFEFKNTISKRLESNKPFISSLTKIKEEVSQYNKKSDDMTYDDRLILGLKVKDYKFRNSNTKLDEMFNKAIDRLINEKIYYEKMDYEYEEPNNFYKKDSNSDYFLLKSNPPQDVVDINYIEYDDNSSIINSCRKNDEYCQMLKKIINNSNISNEKLEKYLVESNNNIDLATKMYLNEKYYGNTLLKIQLVSQIYNKSIDINVSIYDPPDSLMVLAYSHFNYVDASLVLFYQNHEKINFEDGTKFIGLLNLGLSNIVYVKS